MEKSETSSADNPQPWLSYDTVYTNAKAGMAGVDKEKVQRIAYEISKGSKFFKNEEKKEAFMRQKIENMRAQFSKLSAVDISRYQKLADKRVLELESTRDLSRIWLHVDMDAFYAAVETLSNPSLQGKPMAVGSMSMISTANYEARKFGVRAAMPGFIACKLCPELIFVAPDFKKYAHYSDLTRSVFCKYDPHFMAASLDESYLDITAACRERGMTSAEIAEDVRASVYEETGLTCSAGVAPNRLLAKVCSDINKPNGQFVLPNDRMAVMTFISSLPIRKIGGIGKVTESVLKDVLGINTCEEMLQKSGFLRALFSHSTADFFLSVGLGLGKTDTPQVKFRKSISVERTFSATNEKALLYQKLADIAEVLCTNMEKEGLSGRTLTLKLKTASFEVRSRALTLQKYISSRDELLNHATKLLKAELPVSVRLIGLRVSHFNEEKIGAPLDPSQKTLTNFITSRAACRKNFGGHSSWGSDVCDDDYMNEKQATSDSYDTHEYEIVDPSDSNNLQDLNDFAHILSSKSEGEKILEPLTDQIAVVVNTTDMVGSNPVTQLKEVECSSTGQLEGSSLGIFNEFMDDRATVSPEETDQPFWVDEYKCSLCGIEMPPDFVDERQEHYDFHLAERLQEEESPTSVPRQRFVRVDRKSSHRIRKKHKPSPGKGKNLSIDMFFAKSNQNF